MFISIKLKLKVKLLIPIITSIHFNSLALCNSVITFNFSYACMAIFIFIKRLWQRHASKCRDLQVKFQKFSGGYASRPYTGEGLRRPSPDLTPLGAPALRAYRASLEAFGLSISSPTRNPGSTLGAPTLWKSWLRRCGCTNVTDRQTTDGIAAAKTRT